MTFILTLNMRLSILFVCLLDCMLFCCFPVRHLPEVCDDGIQTWTVYDGQPEKTNMCVTQHVWIYNGNKWWPEQVINKYVISSLSSTRFVASLWHSWLFVTVRLKDCAHNVIVPARWVRAASGVLNLLSISVKKSKVSLERQSEWISRWWEDVRIPGSLIWRCKLELKRHTNTLTYMPNRSKYNIQTWNILNNLSL